MAPPDAARGPLRLAVLASGRGTNLQAILDAIADGTLDATVAGVFSDRAGARALERARAAGVAATHVDPKAFATRASHDAALFAAIDAIAPDLVVCAGYMRLIDGAAVSARPGLLVNIHPSLLPAYKGLHTHARAIADGAAEHGASVHFVTADLDGGPVIAQARVPVLPDDDAAALEARVLAVEHPLLLETLRAIASGRVELNAGHVFVDGRAAAAPLQLAANRRFA